MKIKIVTEPKLSDYIEVINLLNKVFSKFNDKSEVYTASYAFKKTKGKSDTAIFEVKNGKDLVAFAIGYERYPNYYHIWQLGVSESKRGKGIAKLLYEQIEKFAKKKNIKV